MSRFREDGVRILIREGVFLGSYGAAKSVAFAGPLWVAAHAPAEVYGSIEFALNVGVWGAMILGLGLSGSIPLRLLVHKDVDAVKAIALFLAGIAGLGIAGAGIAGGIFGSLLIASCCLLTVLSAAQQIGSIYLRVRQWRIATAWVENLAVHSVVLAAVIAYYAVGGFGGTVVIVLAVLCVTVLAIAAPVLLHYHEGAFSSYKKSIKLGFPMLLNGLVMLAVCNSGRLYIGSFLAVTDVAYYAFAFRISGAILVAYQVVNLRFYNQLYTASAERIGLLIFGMTGLFSLIGLVLATSYVWLAAYITPASLMGDKVGQILPLVASQTTLWILTAMLELRINYAERSSRSFSSLLIVPFALIGVFYLLSATGVLSLVAACWLLLVAMTIVAFIQIIILGGAVTGRSWLMGAILLAGLPLLAAAI